jgi:hypothetical protein
LLALKESTASLTTSLNIMVERALARVFSNEEVILDLGATAGLGRFAVAMSAGPVRRIPY